MPGALIKLTNPTILHAYKPYKLFNKLPSSSSAVSPTPIVDSRTIPPCRYIAGRWCRLTSCAATACLYITPHYRQSRKRGRNLYIYTSDSSNGQQDARFHRRKSDNFGTQMGVTVHCKDESPYDQSDMSPPPQNYGEKQPVDRSKLLTLPTILTIGRVVAIPVLLYTFYVGSWWGPTATLGIFLAAATTDWLDGYLARKMKLGTQFGAFLDPVADKLMVAATLILLCTRPFEGQAPWLLTVPAIAIIGREITMSAVREWAASKDKKLLQAVAVNNLGKWKTASQMIALTILLAARDGSLVGARTLVSSGVVLLYVSAWLSLWSLVVYMRKIWKVLLL